jgi:hypothetical protein
VWQGIALEALQYRYQVADLGVPRLGRQEALVLEHPAENQDPTRPPISPIAGDVKWIPVPVNETLERSKVALDPSSHRRREGPQLILQSRYDPTLQ